MKHCAVEYIILLLATKAEVFIKIAWTLIVWYFWFLGGQIFGCLIGIFWTLFSVSWNISMPISNHKSKMIETEIAVEMLGY